MHVITVEVPELGNRCHLVHDGASALVVDPPRDLAAVEQAALAAGIDIVAVADTHVHNDYVSGALGLARRHGADYLLSAEEHVEFERVGVHDGDVVPVGALDVRVIATPGHTRHHQSFLATDRATDRAIDRAIDRAPDRATTTSTPGALLSGGSLLHGTVGRTDLVDDRLAHHLARAQWTSARALGGLDPRTRLLPTHGFGSFCAGTAVEPAAPDRLVTIADQLFTNPALLTNRESFVSDLVAGFGPIPRYYEHMAPLNRAGAGRALPQPGRQVTGEEVADAVLGGSWVVDLRGRTAFAQGHVPGTVSVEYSAQFATYVGWLVPWDDDIVLLTDSPTLLEPALRDLASIGIERVGTHVLAREQDLTATYRRSDWAGYRSAASTARITDTPQVTDRVVVDVRQLDEYAAGHLPGAIHVPVQDVDRVGPTLPAGELWVHCKSGYRAGIAASLLHNLGRCVVHVDDSWDHVADLATVTASGTTPDAPSDLGRGATHPARLVS